jgi:superoxide dismutase
MLSMLSHGLRRSAAKYVEAFMQNVQWEEVNRRYVAAQRAASALRG